MDEIFTERIPRDGRRSSADELIDRIYDELEDPCDEPELKIAAVARLLEARRPVSFASDSSFGSSKRSTQGSFASSRTSYSSASSSGVLSKFPLPPVVEEANSQHASFADEESSPVRSSTSLHRKLQKHIRPVRASTIRRTSDVSESINEPKASPEITPRTRWCPWCDQYFTRPNDFKKHVVQYCCGKYVFVCRNEDCRTLSSGETQAKAHKRESKDSQCRQFGWSKTELQCKREHFGCGFCAKYFNNLDSFIDHFGGDCRPDRVQGRYQQSRQIRALLQQLPLLPIVEDLCLELRGKRDAYKALWWSYKSHNMPSIIRRLEYGRKAKVDDRNPGIPANRLEEFLRDFIKPSSRSHWAWEVVAEEAAAKLESEPLGRQSTQLSYPKYPSQLSEGLQWPSNVFDDQDTAMSFGTTAFSCASHASSDVFSAARTNSFQSGPINTTWPYSDFNGPVGMDSIGPIGNQQAWDSVMLNNGFGSLNDGTWSSQPEQDYSQIRGHPGARMSDDQYLSMSPAALQAASWISPQQHR